MRPATRDTARWYRDRLSESGHYRKSKAHVHSDRETLVALGCAFRKKPADMNRARTSRPSCACFPFHPGFLRILLRIYTTAINGQTHEPRSTTLRHLICTARVMTINANLPHVTAPTHPRDLAHGGASSSPTCCTSAPRTARCSCPPPPSSHAPSLRALILRRARTRTRRSLIEYAHWQCLANGTIPARSRGIRTGRPDWRAQWLGFVLLSLPKLTSLW
ncbi:hypothetical protein PLICRDRAFT_648847 [Plicaturopsis crispa FD-325 SS-3]|nr:hypothetical protein PLICRDRAFT_648847 [Plicaturopsis crispa FD-325 SS-3]